MQRKKAQLAGKTAKKRTKKAAKEGEVSACSAKAKRDFHTIHKHIQGSFLNSHYILNSTRLAPQNLHLLLQESESEPEIVKGLSGDEVDSKNILEGGRGRRRGRAQSSVQMVEKYQQKAQDSDEDSW